MSAEFISIHIAENPCGSHHESARVVADYFKLPNLRYTQNAKNIGFFGSYFYLLESCSTDFIWFLPDDYLPRFDTRQFHKILIENHDKFCVIPRFCLNDGPETSESQSFSFEDWFIDWLNAGSMGQPFYSIFHTKRLADSPYLKLLEKNVDMHFFNEGEFVNAVLLLENISFANEIEVLCSSSSFASQLTPRQLLNDGIRFFGDLLNLLLSIEEPEYISKETFLCYKKKIVAKYIEWFRQLSCAEASMSEIGQFMKDKIARNLMNNLQ